MVKKTKKMRELENRRAELILEAAQLNDTVEAREGKQYTAEEVEKLKGLENEMRSISFDMMALQTEGLVPAQREDPAQMFDTMARECIANKQSRTMLMERAWTAGMDTTGVKPITPLTITDILPPLEKGLVLSKVGIPLMTGLSGSFVVPTCAAVEASLANEKDVLTDKSIDIDKLTPEPVRIGITIPITNQAITESDGLVYEIVKQQAPLAIARVINRALFCTEQYNAKFSGPFYNANKKGTFKGAVPTLAELLQMKAAALAAGVNAETGCYVMSESMKAVLEATPTQAGGGRMIVENGKINGYPVFCTEYINMQKNGSPTAVENVGFGVFEMQPLGQFGPLRMVVDSVTGAPQDITRITINGDWATVTLRHEAFVWMKCGVSA